MRPSAERPLAAGEKILIIPSKKKIKIESIPHPFIYFTRDFGDRKLHFRSVLGMADGKVRYHWQKKGRAVAGPALAVRQNRLPFPGSRKF